MPLVNHSDNVLHAPFAELVVLLLRQFKRLLAEQGIDLTTSDMEALGQAAAEYASLPEPAPAVITALRGMVQDSVREMRERFNLTFAQSLATDMDSLGGWQTTAEFLDIANHKINAELRISAGSTLLVMLGAGDFAPLLLTVIEFEADLNDEDAAFARRALLHFTRVPVDAPDWLAQIRAKVEG